MSILLFISVTYPLDLTKTRLQIQGEIANKSDAKLTRVSITCGQIKSHPQ